MSTSHTAPTPVYLETAATTHQTHPTALALPSADRADTLGLAQIATFVLWTACLTIGALGFVFGYTRPTPLPVAPEPVIVEKIEVALSTAPVPLPSTPTITDPSSAPPPPASLAEAPPAQPIAVADPATVAFALPIDGPTTLVDRSQASHSRPSHRPAHTTGPGLPAPQTLIYGQGEGRQPAPEYPPTAISRRQQGTVGIRFIVSPDGRVREATVSTPSPWPVLDESALRTVRHRWHFPRGPVRVYDVAIRFALAE